MDIDVGEYVTRSGRRTVSFLVLPDADVSEPELQEDEDQLHDEEAVDSSDAESDAENHQESSTFRWRRNLRPPNKDRTWKGSFPAPPEDEWQPIEYFYRFFTKVLISHIVEQTNIYAMQQNSNFRTDVEEVEKFLGCLMKMGIVNMPRYEMYWAQSTRFGPVADLLSRNRFTEIKKYIHFNDNSRVITDRNDPQYDRYFKVRPLLNLLRQACLEVPPEEKMSVDEQMIPFKGKHSLRQYLPKKPKKWGFKVISRTGVSGITYDFILYDGSDPKANESCGFTSGDYVIKLCETLQSGQNHKVYFDNWFTFLEMQLVLQKRGIWSVGTIRSNRVRHCPLKEESKLKKEGRGAYDHSVDANSGIRVLRWFDNKVVQLSSTHVDAEPISSVKRWNRREKKFVNVQCPAIVEEYNSFMGGVDSFNMLMSLYRTNRKSRKWYLRIFFWALNVAIINGWLYYRRHCSQRNVLPKSRLDLLEFTSRVSECMVLKYKLPSSISRKRGRPTSSGDTESSQESSVRKRRERARNILQEVRHDNVGHFPAHSEPKQRCRICSSYVRIKCIKCNSHLCITKAKNCFLNFHVQDNA